MSSRRSFLKSAAAVSGAALISSKPLRAQLPSWSSPEIFECYNDRMVEGTVAIPDNVVEEVVIGAVNMGIMEMARKSDLGEAWQSIFPGIEDSSKQTNAKIAIKMNCLKKTNGPQFATLKAVVFGLRAMFNGNFPANNIYVFDNNWSSQSNRIEWHYEGFDLNSLGVNVDGDNYQGQDIDVVGNALHTSTLLDGADYGICMAASRRHRLYAGGLSGMIKNMMGAVSKNTSGYSALSGGNNGQFHDKNDHSGYVDLFKNYMLNKLHLYIADHIMLPANEAQNGYDTIAKTIILGTDPCAVDKRSTEIISQHYNDCTSEVPNALENEGLGTTNYQVVNVTKTARQNLIQTALKSNRRKLFIKIPDSKVDSIIFEIADIQVAPHISIYTSDGKFVRSLNCSEPLSKGKAVLWDRRNEHGAIVPPGAYVLKVMSGGHVQLKKITLI